MLKEIHWEFTNKCNLNCSYCLLSSGKPRKNELSTRKAKEALKKLSGQSSKICFTGGEPFMREDFLEILKETTRLGMKAEVITNATLTGEKEISLLKELGVGLGVSIDSSNPKINDEMRGKGSLKKALRTLNLSREKGVPTKLYTTVTKKNKNHLKELVFLAEEYECRGIHFNEITPRGRAERNTESLELSYKERANLRETVRKISRDILGESLSQPQNGCWADSSSIYMASNGYLYSCSEVVQTRPELPIGDICSFSFRDWVEEDHSKESECPYRVEVNEHLTLITNNCKQCILTPQEEITALDQLYQELNLLYKGMEEYCLSCNHPDCMGYIWLLQEEADRLYNKRVPLVEVNEKVNFIHSFPKEEGKIDLSVKYPSCSQLCKDRRWCSIHEDRPLTCHLYPLGLETRSDDTIIWALHKDCLFVEKLEKKGELSQFGAKIIRLLNNIEGGLLEEIIRTYRAVDAITAFPEGENEYYTVKEVRKYV